MSHVLILGANGRLARNTLPHFLGQKDVALTLTPGLHSRCSLGVSKP